VSLSLQRVAVEAAPVLTEGGVLSAWLWHGQTPEEALRGMFVRAGLAAEAAAGLVAGAELESVNSALLDLHGPQRQPVQLHRIGLRYRLPATLASPPHHVRADPGEMLAEFGDLGEPASWQLPILWQRPESEDITEPLLLQRPGAYAVIRQGRRIMLVQLRRSRLWTLPGGGIDMGEHPDVAVVREVLEESGQPLADPVLIGVNSARWRGSSPSRLPEDLHAVQILYTGTVPEGAEPVVLEVEGSTETAAWVDLAEVPELALSSATRSVLVAIGLLERAE